MLGPEEVLRFLDAAPRGRDRVLLQTAYACGLRIGELIRLKVADIDSARMVIAVRQGKGRKDRLVPLSPRLLEVLRIYWEHDRPKGWLFPGEDPERPLFVFHEPIVVAELKRSTIPLGWSSTRLNHVPVEITHDPVMNLK